eukprot:6974115-Pyramimonas_sp.AAC.1
MTSRYACKWKFVKNDKDDMARGISLRWVLRGLIDLEAFDVESFFGNSATAKPEATREHGSVQEAMGHCLPRHKHGFPERVDLPGTC